MCFLGGLAAVGVHLIPGTRLCIYIVHIVGYWIKDMYYITSMLVLCVLYILMDWILEYHAYLIYIPLFFTKFFG